MTVSFTSPTIPTGAPHTGSIARSAEVAREIGFSTVLARFDDGIERLEPEQRARVAAEEFVAGSLVLPILRQLRETNQAWGPFAPGRHEKVFGSLLDGEVASKIVRASNFPLVDRLARDLLQQSGHASRTGAPTPPVRGSELAGD